MLWRDRLWQECRTCLRGQEVINKRGMPALGKVPFSSKKKGKEAALGRRAVDKFFLLVESKREARPTVEERGEKKGLSQKVTLASGRRRLSGKRSPTERASTTQGSEAQFSFPFFHVKRRVHGKKTLSPTKGSFKEGETIRALNANSAEWSLPKKKGLRFAGLPMKKQTHNPVLEKGKRGDQKSPCETSLNE